MQNYKNRQELESVYTKMLLDLLKSRITEGASTYGFEYEFQSTRPLDPEIMKKIYHFLPAAGFKAKNGDFSHKSGMHISFEPGGQIEYQSMVLQADEKERFQDCLALMENTNLAILNELNIEYIATGFMPGRKDSPLCLDAERYINLHNRLALCGARGLEMMKGTASIHLHAGINSINEIPGLYSSFIKISLMEDFRMSEERRDIWDNTDSCRCGMPFLLEDTNTPEQALSKIINHALEADHIGENMPFYLTRDLSFDAFMYHLTTIFTDIRLNIKGPSLEIRTLDSMPLKEFGMKWNKFIAILND